MTETPQKTNSSFVAQQSNDSAHVFIPQKFLRFSREAVTLTQNKLRAPDGEQVIHLDKSDRNGPVFRLL